MNESVFTEPPSYESSQLEHGCRDSPRPLPTIRHTSNSIQVSAVTPPLSPVRRVAITTVEPPSTQHDIHEALPRSPEELHDSSSTRFNMHDLTEIPGDGMRGSSRASVRTASQCVGISIDLMYPLLAQKTAGPNAMILRPPADERDSRPRYYITVYPNCFMPLSHITTIFRGGGDDAPRVGEFEMGIFAGPSYRQIGNHPAENLGDVLIKKGVRTNGKWKWTRKVGCVPPDLYWNCNVMPFICSTQPPDSADGVSTSNNAIAWFTPRHMSRGSQAPTTSCQLQVTPRGQNQILFDDIVMSILAIERRILRPTAIEVQGLFNDCTPGF